MGIYFFGLINPIKRYIIYGKRGEMMRKFNYSLFKNQKWDSEILGLVASIYKYAGKQEF